MKFTRFTVLVKIEAPQLPGSVVDVCGAAEFNGSHDGDNEQASDHDEELNRVRPHHRFDTPLIANRMG